MIEKKCGGFVTCTEGIDKETGLLLPWMIMGFKFESQRNKALLMNGTPPPQPHPQLKLRTNNPVPAPTQPTQEKNRTWGGSSPPLPSRSRSPTNRKQREPRREITHPQTEQPRRPNKRPTAKPPTKNTWPEWKPEKPNWQRPSCAHACTVNWTNNLKINFHLAHYLLWLTLLLTLISPAEGHTQKPHTNQTKNQQDSNTPFLQPFQYKTPEALPNLTLPPLTRKKPKKNAKTLPKPTQHPHSLTNPHYLHTTAILITLLAQLPTVEASQWINIDYNAIPTKLHIIGTSICIVLATININRRPSAIKEVDTLMRKKNWDIVLLQETGLVKNKQPHQSTHAPYRQQLKNKIIFNSPKQTTLDQKKQRRTIKDLDKKLQQRKITTTRHAMETDFASNEPADPQGGQAFLIKPNLFQQIIHHKIHKDSTQTKGTNKRLSAISININNHQTIILNAYAPAKLGTKKDLWFKNKLEPVIQEIKNKGWDLILGGDLNTTSSHRDRWSSNSIKKKKDTTNLILKNIITNFDLKDTWREENPKTADYTYHKLSSTKYTMGKKNVNRDNHLANTQTALLNHITSYLPKEDCLRLQKTCMALHKKLHKKCMTMSRLDYILTSKNITTENTIIDHSGHINSDHDPVFTHIPLTPLSYAQTTPQETQKTNKYASHKLQHKQTQAKFQQDITTSLQNIPQPLPTTPSKKIKWVTHLIQEWCNTNIPKNKKKETHKRNNEMGQLRRYLKKTIKAHRHIAHLITKNSPPTLTKTIIELSRAPSWAKIPLPLTTKESTMDYFKTLHRNKQNIKHKLRRAIETSINKKYATTFLNNMNQHKYNLKNFWRRINPRKTNNNTITAALDPTNNTTKRDPTDINYIFRNFWKNLYQTRPLPNMATPWFKTARTIPTAKAKALDTPITTEEV